MKRALDLIDEPGHIIQTQSWPEIAEVARDYSEVPRPGGGAPARQAAAQRLVDDLTEGPAGAARFRLELGRDIVVQGKRRSHVLMLGLRHHDVKAGVATAAVRMSAVSTALDANTRRG